jgi:phage-related minor tail protein
MGSLRIAAAGFAEEGRNLSEGLQETIATIAEMENESEALALAMDVFGRRAGPDMAAAIREGRFSIQEYLDVIENADGAILGTAEASRTMGERMQLMGQRIFAALEPLGSLLFEIGGQIIDNVMPAMEDLAEILQSAFADPEVQEGLSEMGRAIGESMLPSVVNVAPAVAAVRIEQAAQAAPSIVVNVPQAAAPTVNVAAPTVTVENEVIVPARTVKATPQRDGSVLMEPQE